MEERLLGILSEYGNSLYAFCVYLAGNKDAADDLYQDMFVIFLKKAHKLAMETMTDKDINNYLMAVASNIWRNTWRKQKRQEKIFIENYCQEEIWDQREGEWPEDKVLRREKILYLRKCVDSLSPKLRQVVLLYYTGELKTGEIAKALKIPESTVRSRLFKARSRIRERLEESDYGFRP